MTYVGALANVIRSHVALELVPDDSDDLFLIYAVLGLAKGAAVSASDVHDAWVAWCELRGEIHPSAIPFDDLDSDVKAKDQPFVDAIHRALGLTG